MLQFDAQVFLPQNITRIWFFSSLVIVTSAIWQTHGAQPHDARASVRSLTRSSSHHCVRLLTQATSSTGQNCVSGTAGEGLIQNEHYKQNKSEQNIFLYLKINNVYFIQFHHIFTHCRICDSTFPIRFPYVFFTFQILLVVLPCRILSCNFSGTCICSYICDYFYWPFFS